MSTKNPFVSYTVEEILNAERDSFVVQIGYDLYRNKKKEHIFSRAEAEKHYNLILRNILHSIAHGDAKQRTSATRCLSGLSILPFRFQ